jgi:hypothetical protein
MKITYIPSKDELVLKLCSVRGKPSYTKGNFSLWWKEDGTIYAVSIRNYTKELEEFKRNMEIAQLKGIWKGVEVTDEDIKNMRAELMNNISNRYHQFH